MVAKSGSEAHLAARPIVALVRIGACIAVVAAIAGLLVVKGGQIHESLDADNARAIAEDDRSFCTRFGMEPGRAGYAECASALGDIRSRHDQRRADLFF